jgi:hypothetical protein
MYKTLKFLYFKIYQFSKFFTRKLNFGKIKKFDPIRKINLSYFNKINFSYFKKINLNYFKKIKIINNKFFKKHLPLAVIFFTVLYLIIPTFYNYNKSNFENIICKNKKIKCIIDGKVNYRFYPSPRIKIKKLTIHDLTTEKKLIVAEKISIKLSIKNLLVREKHNFKKIELEKYTINQDLQNVGTYKDIFKKQINLIPINFKKGEILFFSKKEYVFKVSDANLKIKLIKNLFNLKLNGNFLDDKLYLDWKTKNIENTEHTEAIFKMSSINLITKMKFERHQNEKGIKNGNVSIKKDGNKITAIFDYLEDKLIINKSSLRNSLLDGKLNGEVEFMPYFKFDLDISLTSLNFTKLYTYFLSLNENTQKNIFKINNKINGLISLSSDKIYSSYNLIKSFESRLRFNNGNILIDQFLFNFGKLGAADLVGTVNHEKKYSNLKYESNIFIDNKKKFKSKFGIYNKKEIFDNLYVSGNFDLLNIKNSFYEIEGNEKVKIDDINFIENEFNRYMLSDSYKDLFLFNKFKNFVKSITSEVN